MLPHFFNAILPEIGYKKINLRLDRKEDYHMELGTTTLPASPIPKKLYWVFLIIILFFATPVSAESPKNGGEFANLKQRLIQNGFEKEEMDLLFSNPKVCFDPKGVSLFFIHQESSLNYDQFVSKKSIRNAARYMDEHKNELLRAQKTYGVDMTVITAIILVETRLGTYLGSRTVINTLATMAAISDKKEREILWNAISDSRKMTREKFEKKADAKSEWAYTELKALLKFAQREGVDPVKITGSYAGAMGIAQFMPSNALTLARDGNQDGKINLFNHADAICSIANYLKHFGWKPSISRQQAHKILYKYNHSNYYVDTLLKISDRLKG